MPKRKTPQEKPKDQFKRFLEAAEDKQVDEKRAELAFKALRPKPERAK